MIAKGERIGDVETVAELLAMPVGGRGAKTPLKGLLTPMRVPLGVLNATANFQAMVIRELEGLNGMMWVDDTITWRTDFDDLLHTLDAMSGRLERVGLYATAHKRMLYNTSFKWYGKVYPGGAVKHGQERVPQDEVYTGIAVEGTSHESMGFLSGVFLGSQFP